MALTNSSNTSYEYDFLEYCDEEDNTTAVANVTMGFPTSISSMTVILVTSYSLICFIGLIGNGLVIYVVLRFAKMKTVTNLYILNLAISDAFFLMSLPFLVTTSILHYWPFGAAMCKIFFVLVSINLFTGIFTLTALSGDRYLAVCHPVRSSQYRTTNIAFFVCLCLWSISFVVMLPIILYSTTVQQDMGNPTHETCTIVWPKGQLIPASKAFTWYTFLLGFAIPVSMISVLYLSVILRLRTVGPVIKSKEKRRTHRKVTRMVLTVIFVYIICWLPYWGFQVHLTFMKSGFSLPEWRVYLFSFFTVLTNANSMLNPVLYAFLSDNFRRSFAKAFKCLGRADMDRSIYTRESSVPAKSKQWRNDSCKTPKGDKYEMATMLTSTDNTHQVPKSGSKGSVNDESNLYVDKESQTQ
ncbi:somatostatin receptor type 2-like [Mizuhopecten yessoensis]|uniref:Somatostatin receptor type 2 n=1 Tax=Mizuhopecten yessoensis TaxID=6573 RepID=A0A210PUF3_MIZYE|nr:somatostatin receptor type 2-like [Mizuhopecten yessoensis]OWF40085.1 Somatostatin receptor type 2 [Mizuhopecten yessoensis]